MDFEKTLFRASSAGHLMVNSRDKKNTLSETTKKHLIDVYVAEKYERHTDIFSKAIEKGLNVEEDSITLYSQLRKVFFRKNETSFQNEFIKGTPDIIHNDTIIDIKSSYDLYTFHRSKFSQLNQLYHWQMQCYMALTGIQKAKIIYCLVNTPSIMIEDEKRRLYWKMGVIDESNNPQYIESCKKIEFNMTYDDIPKSDRVHEISIEFSQTDIDSLYKKVQDCREYMHQNFN